MIKQILLCGLSLALVGLCLLHFFTSNFCKSDAAVWLLTAASVVYTVFWRQLDPWLVHTLPGRLLLTLLAAGVLLLAGLICLILSGQVRHTADGTEQALIVLGCAVLGTRPSQVLVCRLQAALDYHRKNPAAVIVVCGGQGPQEDISEALAMQRWLTEHGVPEDRICMEQHSTSTEENFRFAAALLKDMGRSPAAPAAFATSGFHCYRAGVCARREGFLRARAVPARSPRSQLLFNYLREPMAILYSRLVRQRTASGR